MKPRVWCLIVVVLLVAGQAVTQAAQFCDFTYESSGTAVTITGYGGPGGAVTIPDTIGLPVTSIGDLAFWGCTGLTSVVIPGSVTGLGAGAFHGCSSLTSVTISDSITSIGDGAFYGCVGLPSVVIPDSVTSIGNDAFGNCTGLTSIEVHALNPAYCSLDGVLFNKGATILIQCPGGKAGSYTIPNSVTSIGYMAFYPCSGLTGITVDPLNPAYSSQDGVLFSKSQATLIQCPGGKAGSYIIPHSVTSIGDQAFRYCIGLTNIVIPNSVTSIGRGAFGGCTGLTSVRIPNSVISFGAMAFSFCTGLTGVHFEGNAPLEELAFVLTPATVYYLPVRTGWGLTFSGRPTAVWQPRIEGIGTFANQIGFTITWASDRVLVVEACTELAQPVWSRASSLTLTNGTATFTDPAWAQYPARFYRVRGE